MSAYRSYSSLGLSAQAGQAAKHRTITLDAPEHEKKQRGRPEAPSLQPGPCKQASGLWLSVDSELTRGRGHYAAELDAGA